MLKFTLRQLEYAVTVADCGTVAAAAHLLGVAQPSISAALKNLENQVGMQLFVRRTAKGVVPSPQGARFLSEARSLMSHARELERASTGLTDSVAGELRIGCFHTLAPVYIPRLISSFSKRHPGVVMRLEEGDEGRLFDGLRGGRLDLALIYRVADAPDIQMADVATLTPHVILPAGHALAKRKTVDLRDLANEPFISLNIEPSRTYFNRLLLAAGVTPKITTETSSIELLRAMVGHGMGYSVLITRPVGDRSYDGKRLAVRDIGGEVECGIVSLATLKTMRPTHLVATFISFATQFISSTSRSEA